MIANLNNVKSLYIHIPFCKKICPYCDFVKVYDYDVFRKRYIEEIIKDISFLIENKCKFKTIYIGGGTPSVLNEDELIILLKEVSKLLDKNYEFTIEANPESLSEKKLKIMTKYGINRISIGIQSFDKKVLKIINRDYDVDIFSLINMVKKYINNINVDLIYGIPTQTFKSLKEDLINFSKLDINHISTYSLIVDKGSQFFNDKIEEQNDDESRKMYDYILSFLTSKGFSRYEVSNFSKPGFESKHNLTYWKDKEYIGIGIGASGYINKTRYKNSASLTRYLNGDRDLTKEFVTLDDDKEYFLITNLRLKDGFLLNEYEARFNENILETKKDNINKLINSDLLIVDELSIKPTDEGIMLLDFILRELI